MKARYESFGGIIAIDEPAATVYVDQAYMREMGYPTSPLWENGRGHLSAPVTVHFAVTNRCPMGCRTCYNVSGAISSDELCSEEIKRVLEELAQMQVFTVAFGGGEPLAHPDIFHLARYARQLGMTPTMTTNGFYINYRTAWQARIFSHVHVSIDGVGDVYLAVRGVDGFPHASRALKLLRRCGVSVGVNVVVCRANYNHLEELVRFVVDQGVNDIIFLRLKPGGRAREFYMEQRLTPDQSRDLYPLLERLAHDFDIQCHVDCAMMPFVYYHHPDKNVLQMYGGEGCVAGREIIEISPRGRVNACSFVNVPACSVSELRENWNDAEELNKYRNWVENAPEPCSSCQYMQLCRGGCRALAEAITGDFSAPDPECPFVLERSLR
jgi:radical SAM protein with 4Fe4S-binding SPASM domain